MVKSGMRLSAVDIVLFGAYTMASVVGLLLIKSWMPLARASLAEGVVYGLPIVLVVFGAALYVVSFLIWILILAHHDLSFAYPVAIGLTLVFSSLAASLLLNEAVPLARLFGMIMIFLGVVLVVRA